MHKPIKYAEKSLSYAANGAWFFYSKWNQIAQRPSFTPAWSDTHLQPQSEPRGAPAAHSAGLSFGAPA